MCHLTAFLNIPFSDNDCLVIITLYDLALAPEKQTLFTAIFWGLRRAHVSWPLLVSLYKNSALPGHVYIVWCEGLMVTQVSSNLVSQVSNNQVSSTQVSSNLKKIAFKQPFRFLYLPFWHRLGVDVFSFVSFPHVNYAQRSALPTCPQAQF